MTHTDRPELWAPFRLRLPAASGDRSAMPVGAKPEAAVLEAIESLARAASHPRARELLGRLREGAVPVVTAHQPCLFGGPMYVLVKALSAWAEAERLRRDRGVDAVPLFWVGGDDHDRDEVASVDVVHGGDRRPTRHTAADDFPPLVPVGPHPPGAACRRVWTTLAEVFDAPRAATLLAALREAALFTGHGETTTGSVSGGTAPSMTLGFVRWLVGLLGSRAPLFVDAASPALRSVGRALLGPILADPEAFLHAARERTAALVAAGLPAPVSVDDDALPAFLHDEAGRRRRLLWKGGDRFGLRGVDGAELRPGEILGVGPERLSPNVLLRPLVQEHALGPGVSILGPTEHAYHAQSAAWYEHLLGAPAGSQAAPSVGNGDATGSILLRRPSVTVCTARDAERLTAAG
ncbi:MAG TPA: bacillithiol biosynthesis BshC, partial [Polyangiaceae bacterium LLY-WYZ-14_1]|nr:bacillithiol biosynthesis BshC [Polyangiaceae bacterium LLY-WYZ-14_1]